MALRQKLSPKSIGTLAVCLAFLFSLDAIRASEKEKPSQALINAVNKTYDELEKRIQVLKNDSELKQSGPKFTWDHVGDSMLKLVFTKKRRRGKDDVLAVKQAIFISPKGYFVTPYRALFLETNTKNNGHNVTLGPLVGKENQSEFSVDVPAYSPKKKSGIVAHYKKKKYKVSIVSYLSREKSSPIAAKNANLIEHFMKRSRDWVIGKIHLAQGEKVEYLTLSTPKKLAEDTKGKGFALVDVYVPFLYGESFLITEAHMHIGFDEKIKGNSRYPTGPGVYTITKNTLWVSGLPPFYKFTSPFGHGYRGAYIGGPIVDTSGRLHGFVNAKLYGEYVFDKEGNRKSINDSHAEVALGTSTKPLLEDFFTKTEPKKGALFSIRVNGTNYYLKK